jgi:hypothetical protein
VDIDWNKVIGVLLIIIGFFFSYSVLRSMRSDWNGYTFVKSFFAGFFAILLGIILVLGKATIF